MIKKVTIAIAVMVGMLTPALAATIQWDGTVLDSGATAAWSTYTVYMYQVADSVTPTLPSAILTDGSTDQADSILSSTATSFINVIAGAGATWASSDHTDSGLGFTDYEGEDYYVFSVVFNTTTFDDLSTASQYIIVDDQPTEIEDPEFDPNIPYAAGTASSGEWQDVVPEPGTMALFGIGLLTLATRRRKRA